MRDIYYVYTHIRLDKGTVFYVGKGRDKRAWIKRRGNAHWRSIVAKTEYSVEIVQSFMSEADAFLLEMWLIAKFRHSGLTLANKTDGGDGVSGFKKTTAQRLMLAKPVYCSNGMFFESTAYAAEWVRSQGTITASVGMISSCCLGRKRTAYGHSWSHDDFPPEPEYTGRSAMAQASVKSSSVSVVCSNGMVFPSRSNARDWLRENGHPKASDSAIVACCKGKYNTAYGYTWRMEGDPEKELLTRGERISISQGTPVSCSNGMSFHSINAAASWLRDNGRPKASGVNIKKQLDGKLKTCYGFKWSYIE